jgi:hypothetical protein
MEYVTPLVDNTKLKSALNTPIASFKNFVQILEKLVKDTPNWDKIPLDIFLVYQWSIKGDNTRTFLELPKNTKHGSFITKTTTTDFTEVKTSGLKYVNEKGEIHPFKRSKWFMESNFANPIVLDAKIEESPFGDDSDSTETTTW